MKKIIQTIFIFLFFSTNFILHAQDTLYYDENLKKITDGKEFAEFYRLCTIIKEKIVLQYYRMDGTLYEEHIYTFHFYGLRTDTLKLSKRYNGNNLYWEDPFKNGKRHGNLVVYWENGKVKRNDKYVEGKFIKGTCFDETGKKTGHGTN